MQSLIDSYHCEIKVKQLSKTLMIPRNVKFDFFTSWETDIFIIHEYIYSFVIRGR